MTVKTERLLAAQTPAELWSAFAKMMRNFGLPDVIYGAQNFIDIPQQRMVDEVELFSTYPKRFIDSVMAESDLVNSPWTAWSLANSGAIPGWQITDYYAETLWGENTRRMDALAHEHGVAGGYIYSLRGVSVRRHGLVALSPGGGAAQEVADSIWGRHGRTIMTLAQVLHLRMNAMPRGERNATLTQRQREVLEWAASGKTVAEIAAVLGVTPATVEKHLRLARESLDVGTTAQAILKAHLQQMIFITPADPAYPRTAPETKPHVV